MLTCMDARVDLARVLHLRPDTSVVIRNAGGRAADALRSLVIAHHELGLPDVFVIHHTDCLAYIGASNARDHDVAGRLEHHIAVGFFQPQPFNGADSTLCVYRQQSHA